MITFLAVRWQKIRRKFSYSGMTDKTIRNALKNTKRKTKTLENALVVYTMKTQIHGSF